MTNEEKKIEEAAITLFPDEEIEEFYGDCAYMFKRPSWIEGVKSDVAKEYWQKGMYTEEEVKRLCSKAWLKIPNTVDMLESFDKWFEQNKKK